MPKTSPISLAEQLDKVPPAVRPIVRAAIKAVTKIAPDAEEIPYDMAKPRTKTMVWKLVRYSKGGQNVVGVGTLTGHSILFLYRGRELDDGSGLLQGGGKEARFITLRTPADSERPEVRSMVRKAFKLASG